MDTKTNSEPKTLSEIVAELEKTMQCNCDLDRWEPQRSTGHTFACRIHMAARERYTPPNPPTPKGANNMYPSPNQTPDPGVKAEMPRYFALLYEALSELQKEMPRDRSERDRAFAIAKTDLEKVIAYVGYYLI